MELSGLHHITAVTGNAPANVRFYTQVLGMRMVKKTVNQDDVQAYHLFYADAVGSPGTDLTFFDWPHAGPNQPGTHTIGAMGLRVHDRASLDWWAQRLDEHGVGQGGVETWGDWSLLRFTDPEGQHLYLVDDGGLAGGAPWSGSPVPAERQIKGLHSVVLTEAKLDTTEMVLTQTLGFRRIAERPVLFAAGGRAAVFESGQGGPGAFVVVEETPQARPGRVGIGGVHHVAFRTPDGAQQQAWDQRLRRVGLGTSGIIDRFYFQSLYFREPGGVLFEIATDGPGFAADEAVETMGQRLALPPFLEPRRASIEAGLKPL